MSDYETMFPGVRDAILMRCNTRNWYFNHHPNTVSFAWPVEDYAECVDVPEGGFKYAVSFQGWISTTTRQLSAESCRDAGLPTDIAMYSDFCGYIYDQPEGVRRRAEFRRSMHESRVCLCPESIPGVFPYRFFESMSAGRVPMLVASDYVFPFESKIPYSEFCILMERDEARNAGPALRKFINRTSDETIIEMGRKARHYWEKYLDARLWPKMHAQVVRQRIEALQCV